MQKDAIKDNNKSTITDLFALFFLLISSLLISLPLLNDFPINTDEGIILHGTIRVLNGEVPYRDFWHITLPGAVWIYALVFKIAGETFIVARFTGYLFIAGQSMLIYLIGKSVLKRSIVPLLASIFYFLYISIAEVNCEPHIISVFFALLALFLFVSNKSPWMHVITGIAIGLSIMAQQNIGAAGFVAFLVLLLLENFKDGFDSQKYLRNVLLISAGLLIVFIPFIFFIFYTNTVHQAIYALFVWPFQNYTGFNKYPYLYAELTQIKNWYINHGFSLHYLIDITPIIITGFLPILVIPYLIYTGIREKNYPILTIIIYSIMLMLSVVLLRADYHHLLFVSPLNFLLIFYLIFLPLMRRKDSKIKPLLLTISLFLSGIIFLSLVRWSLFYKSIAFSQEISLETARGRVSITYKTPPWMYDVIRYIETSTERNESIFVYHWSPVIYFLTDRNNPTHFNTYIPIYNTEKQLQDIIESLRKNRPHLIIKDRYIDYTPEHPNILMFPNVDWTTLLDKDPVHKYIEENYLLKGNIGSFKIFTLPE